MVEGLRVQELTYPGMVFLQESLRGGRGHRWEEKNTKHCDHENMKKNRCPKRLTFWTVAWQRQVVRLCLAGLWIINDRTHTNLFKQPEFVKEISWLTEFLEGPNSQVRGYASRNNAQTPTWGSFSKDPPLLLGCCCETTLQPSQTLQCCPKARPPSFPENGFHKHHFLTLIWYRSIPLLVTLSHVHALASGEVWENEFCFLKKQTNIIRILFKDLGDHIYNKCPWKENYVSWPLV